MDGGEKVAGGPAVAGSDGTELLEPGEEVLDQVTHLIEVLVVGEIAGAVAHGWDDGGASGAVQDVAEAIGVEGLVGEQAARPDAFDEWNRANTVVALAFGDLEGDRQPKRVDDQVNLGRRPTSRLADCIACGPPFPPDACW